MGQDIAPIKITPPPKKKKKTEKKELSYPNPTSLKPQVKLQGKTVLEKHK